MTLAVAVFGAGAMAALFTFALVPVFRSLTLRWGAVDIPNERSSHAVPTPRAGGKAMVIGITAAVTFASVVLTPQEFVPVIASTPLLVLSGLIDDIRRLAEWQKFLAQIAGAIVFITVSEELITQINLGAFEMNLGIAAVPLTIFWLVGYTNAFNFMDGINGIAAMHAIVSGLVLGILAVRHGDGPSGVMAASVVGSAAGFLPWNFPKARVFMGDTGSLTIGFLIAVLVVRLARYGAVVAILPTLPFVFDTCLTLVRRIVRREAWFKAHRSHLYQQLIDLGWSHAQVATAWALAAAACGVVALQWQRIEIRVGPILPLASLVGLHAVAASIILMRHANRLNLQRH